MYNLKNLLKNYYTNNKRRITAYGILALIIALVVIFVHFDFELYKSPIGRVVESVNTFEESVQGSDGDEEMHYTQNLTVKILNGIHKGEEIDCENSYTHSGVYDEKYTKGDWVFITLNGNNRLTGEVTGIKRDAYVAALVGILLWLIIVCSGKKGIFTIVSLIINITLYLLALKLYENGYDIFNLVIALVVLYTILTLFLISGFNKKTIIAIVSIFISVAITITLFKITLHYNNNIEYWMMDYITNVKDLERVFLAGILLGGLGACMDVAISLAASIAELVSKDEDIKFRTLIKSGREIGYDIMGTMINVLLFTFIAGSLPMLVFKMKNQISIFEIIQNDMQFELYRFLVGSIGIVLTVPITIFLASLIYTRRKRT